MLLSDIRLAIRKMVRQKISSLINILGLVAGLTAALFVLLFILNELSYDKHHEKGARIYRIIENNHIHNWLMATTPFPLAEAVRLESPAVEQVARVYHLYSGSIQKDQQWIAEKNLFSADPAIFDMFTLPIAAGNVDALQEPNTAVLSEEYAQKYFGDDNPLDRILKISIGDTLAMVRIIGIMNDLPRNSTFRPGIVVSPELGLLGMSRSLITTGGSPPGPRDLATSWEMSFFTTYLMLQPGADTVQVSSVFQSLEQKHYGEEPIYSFYLQPLKDIYLESGHLINSDNQAGDWQTIYIFSGIGLLIIIISALNYILFYSGQTILRSKEYGIRKVVGASRANLMRQVIIETSIIVFLVLPVCLILIEIFRPEVSQFLGKNLAIEPPLTWQYPAGFVFITLLLGLIPGVSMISYISRIQPAVAMESPKLIQRGHTSLRNILVMCQFIIFNILLICSLGIYKQIQYTFSKDLGFQWKNLMIVKTDQGSLTDHFNVIKNELSAVPGIRSISGGMFIPPTNSIMSIHTNKLDGSDESVNIEALFVDPDFLETLGIKLTTGQSLSDFDNYEEWKIVLNQKALDLLGAANPIGEKMIGGQVVGIFKDFNSHSLHREIPPMMIVVSMDNLRQMVIRYDSENESALKTEIIRIITNTIPGCNPEITFTQDVLKELYRKERKTAVIVGIFTAIALFIGAMGLFGMSMHTLQSRRREFAIRRVNGAQMHHILRVLSGYYLMMIISTLVVSSPLAILLLKKWFQNFVYKTSLSWWIFALTGSIAVIIVFGTVGYHIIRAATRNPSESLRYE